MKKQLSIFNYSFKNQGNGIVEIFIDGDILDSPTQEFVKEYWGDTTSVSYKSLRDQITESGSKQFNVYFNSGGGHIGDAMAIHDLFVDLQSKGYTINTIGRGIIASAATYPLMSSPNSSITENSSFMIHNVSGGVWGDVNVIENYAAAMRKFNNIITKFYANKTGLSETVVGNMMNKETWLTGQEAVDKQFVSKVIPPVQFDNAIPEDKWMFNNTEVLSLYNSFTTKNSIMDLKKVETAIENGFKNLMEKLGLANKVDESISTEALKNFTDSVVNGIKETMPTPESIQEMVNQAIAKATEGDAKAIEDAVKEGTKNLVDSKNLEETLNALKSDLAKALGNSSNANGGGNQQKPATAGNRFANRTWFNEGK